MEDQLRKDKRFYDTWQYRKLHEWLRNDISKPELCEDCNERPPIELANITGTYNRDAANFRYLCRVCHLKRDRGIDISDLPNRTCSLCGSATTYIIKEGASKPRQRWHYHKVTHLPICGKCRLGR